MYLGAAATGSRPVHFAISDSSDTYWCKWPGNPHGDLSLAHEWVVARLGEFLAAPVCLPALVYVSEDLVRRVTSEDGVPLPSGHYFGSRNQRGEEGTEISHVQGDGNSERFAHLLALWELCLGEDVQFMYDLAQQGQVWSYDHGLWFHSLEGPWSAPELGRWTNRRWEWPAGNHAGVSGPALVRAANTLAAIDEPRVAGLLGEVPLSWNVSDADLEALGRFILDRAPSVIASLKRRSGQAGMGREA